MNHIQLGDANYRGFCVRWDDFLKRFEIRDNGETIKRQIPSLAECQEWIDKRLKAKFNRVNVYFKKWAGDWLCGAATSLIEDGGQYYVWVIDGKNQRSKENISDIFVQNDPNLKLVDGMNLARAQIKTLEKEHDELFRQLEVLKPEMMTINPD